MVVRDKLDCSAEAENHLRDSNTYKGIKFGYNDLVNLVEQSSKIFKHILSKQNISCSESNYLSYNYKKLTNLDGMHLLLKITYKKKGV